MNGGQTGFQRLAQPDDSIETHICTQAQAAVCGKCNGSGHSRCSEVRQSGPLVETSNVLVVPLLQRTPTSALLRGLPLDSPPANVL